MMAAARWLARSEPANSQFDLPNALGPKKYRSAESDTGGERADLRRLLSIAETTAAAGTA